MKIPDMLDEHFLNLVSRTLHNRGKSYGDSQACFDVIAKRWGITLGVNITPQQVAMCMIDLKLARLANDTNHLDSMIDIAGYAALMAENTPLKQSGGIMSVPSIDEARKLDWFNKYKDGVYKYKTADGFCHLIIGDRDALAGLNATWCCYDGDGVYEYETADGISQKGKVNLNKGEV